jgi:predicted F0F1-ATPase subunit
MKKAAAQRDETTTVAQDELDAKLQKLNTSAQKQFFGATFTLGWRLAITVLIPLIAGIKLDQHFHTSHSYTLAGFMIAAAAGASAVWATVKEVNQEQQDEAKKEEDKRA